MIQKIKIFLKILRIELEDLNEDIKLLVKECKEKHSTQKISEYVFQENLAVLQNELSGIEDFYKDLSKVNQENYKNLDEFVDYLKKTLKNKIREKGLVHSIYHLVERKINKVANYIMNCND